MTAAPPRVALVGAGRAGCSFYENLYSKGYPVAGPWSRSEAGAAAARADGIPATTAPLASVIAGADVVLLAVADRAIGAMASELAKLPAGPGAVCAHLSGAHGLDVLAPAAAAGWHVGSLHPLLSIASRHASLAGAWASVDAAGPDTADRLAGIAADLGLSVLRPSGDRARYHAAACVAGNYAQALLEAAIRLLESTGVPRDDAWAALVPLLRSAVENAAGHGPAAGLTGPIARGDVETVRRHLASLAALGDTSVEALYRGCAQVAAELAGERKVPDSELIRAMARGGG